VSKRIALILEIAVLFGPAALLLLFLGPAAVTLLLDGRSIVAVLIAATAVALGVIGLVTVLQVATHLLGRDHHLPRRISTRLGLVCGIGSCALALWLLPVDIWTALVLLAPIVGTLHLLVLLWMRTRTAV